MFAVPGWAVSSEGPKAETAGNAAQGPKDANGLKKRKRQSAPGNVTTNNVADLWETVIEGRQQKKSKSDQEGSTGNPNKVPLPHGAPRLTLKEKKKLKKLKEKEAGLTGSGPVEEKPREATGKPQKEKKSKGREDAHEDNSSKAPSTESQVKAPSAPVKLTPMQAAMREKLVSARFRHLNETLYTKPSAEAFQLFHDSPEMFQEYHEGFRRQVNVWPENPVNGYIEDIKLRGRQRHSQRSKPGQATPAPTSAPDVHPLVRTNGVCTIADLGCGDAKLATVLQSEKKKLNLNILSYDLQSPSPLVTRADIANLPLADGSVDVAIFCLALMGTNWLDFIEEAYRILHWKGELWVAEIKSRFGHVSNKAKNAPVNHSVGNRRKTQEKKKGNGKGKDADSDEKHNADLAVEVDGGEDRRQETDVTAFVEALRRRGFVLQGNEKTTAIDMSNKMFVKMHFVKAAQPSVGKGAVAARDSGRGGKKGGVKFIDAQEEDGVDETMILKPSVYKISLPAVEMQITLSVNNPEVEEQELRLLTLGVYPEMTIEALRSSIEAEGIPAPAQHLYHNGELITDNTKTLEELHITDGDMLALHVRDMRGSNLDPSHAGQAQRRRPAAGPGNAAPLSQDPELIRLQILGDPALRAQLQRLNHALAAALEDPQRFAQLYQNGAREQEEARLARMREIEALNADEFNPSAQARIEEMIRQESVVENLQNAMEYNPESFGRVHLLYIDVKVNGFKVKALVDSGAQATIMSPSCAEQCNIMRLVDRRFAGVARGVGTANIIGRVHSTILQVGSKHLHCAFTVMEGKAVDLLLGLDILKGHQATIDLARNRLIIQGEEVEFLGESDIPKATEEAINDEPTVPGPGGTTIGARSGAVTAPSSSTPDSSRPFAPATASSQPAASAPAPAPAPAPALPARRTFPESDIEKLLALGFDRRAAINALQATDGNVEYAAGLLFQN